MRLSGSTRGLCTVVAVLLLIAGYRGAAAASLPQDLCALRDASSAVVQGRVERIVAGWQDPARKLIASEVVIRVSGSLQGGAAPGSLLTVRVAGGQIGDLVMASSEEAAFAVGESVLLFVTTGPGSPVVTAGALGKFHVIGDLAFQQATQTAYRMTDLLGALAAPTQDAQRGGDNACQMPAVVATAPAPGVSPDSYVYNGFKWYGPNPMEEQYLINVNTARAGGSNGSVTAFRDAIIAAGNAWTAVGSADFAFRYGGSTTVATTGYDGLNVIHWENMGSGSVLAEATTWYSSGRILETDIRINEAHNWDATGAPSSNEMDLQSVVLHELGHWLSLGHDTDPICSSCPATGPVMCYCYRTGSLKRNLAPNDRAGISTIYPMSANETPTPTATRTLTPTRSPTPSRTPTATATRAPFPDWWPKSYLPLIWRR